LFMFDAKCKVCFPRTFFCVFLHIISVSQECVHCIYIYIEREREVIIKII